MEFEQIYDTYFNDVYLYIRRLSGDEHLAEEITSETFFKALRSIDSFRGECDLRVWLCQIAKNTYYSYLKKSGRTEFHDIAEIVDVPDSDALVDEQITRLEEQQQVQKALHTLPEPYKEVFMWRAFADLSFKQIGALFNKTDNWACVTYHRARKLLQNRLEGFFHEK